MQNVSTSVPVPSRWQVLSAEPHRLGFFLGAIQIVLVMLWWLLELASRFDHPWYTIPTLSVPPSWMHSFFMLYGVFPFFIYGFLFTVYPRWLGGAVVPRHRYLTTFWLAALGMGFVYAGMFTVHGVLLFGLALHLAGWLSAVTTLWCVYRQARTRSPYEILIIIALICGAFGIGAFMVGVLTDDTDGIITARQIGLWAFLVPVLLIVSHRMIPFFTNSAIPLFKVMRPPWSLWLFFAGSVLHGIFDTTELVSARLATDLVLATVALYHSWLWGFRRSFQVRLLAVLHIAFLWFGISMMLYTLQAALEMMDADILGRAPLHALTIGFITSMLIAMATRVTLGHSGRPLVATALPWYGFLGLNIVALTRVLAEFIPPAYQGLNLIAAVGWLICILPWVICYTPIYLRPRTDQQAG